MLGFAKTKAPKQKLTPEQERVLGFVADRLREQDKIAHVGRYSFERIWYICAAHYHGLQWHDWDVTRNMLAAPKERRSRRRITANWLLPTVQRAVSLVYGSEPTVRIAPASEERKDKEGARISQKAWEHFAESNDLRELDRQALTGAAVLGHFYYKVGWNASCGPRVMTNEGVTYQGDVRVSLASPWEVVEDPAAIRKEDSTWMAQQRWVPVQTLRQKYPKLAPFIKGHPEEAEGNQLHRRLKGVTSMGAFSISSLTPNQDMSNHGVVRFVDFWCRPCEDFPKGLHVKMCGGTSSEVLLTLDAKEWENPHVGMDDQGEMELPFYMLPWMRGIERRYPIGLVEPLLPIQREMNNILSETAETRELHMRPGWLIPIGSGWEGRQIPTGPDRQIPYNPMAANGQMPMPIPMQNIPDSVFRSADDYVRHWQMIASQNDAISGNAPASTRTGRAIALLQMQDDSVYGQVRRTAFGVKSKVARAVLTLMQRFYREGDGRMLKIAGAGNDWEVRQFSGADLRGGTDIRFIQDNGLGNTVEARQEVIDKLMERQILRPGVPEHDRIIIESMELSNTAGAIYGGLSVDEREAQRELALLTALDATTVEPIDAQEYQNHDVHIEVKLGFWKSAEREAMGEDQQAMLWANIEQHVDMREALMQAAAEASGGAPGEEEPGSAKKPGGGKGEPGQPSPPKQAPSDDTLEQARASGGMNS